LSLLAAMVIWVYPSFEAEVDLDQLLAAYPEPVLQVMGVQTMASLGGFPRSNSTRSGGSSCSASIWLRYGGGRSPTMSSRSHGRPVVDADLSISSGRRALLPR